MPLSAYEGREMCGGTVRRGLFGKGTTGGGRYLFSGVTAAWAAPTLLFLEYDALRVT